MDERSPEDQLAIELAKVPYILVFSSSEAKTQPLQAQQWRRCPGCHAIVELTQGCNHIKCLCKKEFCFKCGCKSRGLAFRLNFHSPPPSVALWDTKKQRCTSNPACELWDETMLLDTREREREAVANRVAQAAARPAPARAAPMFNGLANLFGGRAAIQPPAPEPPRPALPRARGLVFDEGGDFDWIDNPRTYSRFTTVFTDPHSQPGIAGLGHPFTREMITNLTCGYCNSRLNSINDLRYHLSNVQYHSVFSCCGRFFKREADLQKHQESKPTHSYETIRHM